MTRFTRPRPPVSRSLRTVSFAALLLPFATPASAQERFLECTRVLHTSTRASDDGSGQALASVPDVNGDGVAELLVGSPSYVSFHLAGRLQLVDGRTGIELLLVEGTTDDNLGRAVAPAGDVDGDGIGDLLASALGLGAVRVYSGANAALLVEATGPANAFGVSVASVGDIDSDGVPDFAVGEVASTVISAVPGRVSFRSGADGQELYSLPGSGDQRFGTEIVAISDVDATTVLAVLCPGWDFDSAHVSVIDVLTGVERFRHTPDAGTGFHSIAALGNVNTHPRITSPGLLVLGAVDGRYPINYAERGLAQVLNAETGALVTEVTTDLGEFFGKGAGIDDVDLDRMADFVACGSSPFAAGYQGWVGVYSSRSGWLKRKVTRTGWGPFSEVIGGSDVDGDGFGELVTAVPTLSGNEIHEEIHVIASTRPVELFGDPKLGSSGITPQISIGGCPRIQGTLRVETERVLGGALGTLLVGATRADRQFRGGTVYPSPDLRFLHRASGPSGVPGAGNASLSLAMPGAVALTGLTAYAQALYLDAGVAGGISLTQALKLTLY